VSVTSTQDCTYPTPREGVFASGHIRHFQQVDHRELEIAESLAAVATRRGGATQIAGTGATVPEGWELDAGGAESIGLAGAEVGGGVTVEEHVTCQRELKPLKLGFACEMGFRQGTYGMV
jgi:hypothetical protein